MDDIYHRAVEIIISLGKYATDVAKLIKMMKHPADNDTSSQVHRNGFHIFLGHPYWKRLWTVQEVLLARNLTIMYGADTLAWHHLAECWDTIRPGEKAISNVITDNLGALVMFRKDHRSVKNLKLHEEIRHFCIHRCLDPRDKIFGLLGIVRREERIEIDYEMTPNQIFHAVAKVTVRYENRAPRERSIMHLLILYRASLKTLRTFFLSKLLFQQFPAENNKK